MALEKLLFSEAKLFFDLNVLPKDIVINSAILTLAVDTIQTKTGTNFTNSLRVYLLKDSSKNELNTNFVYTLKRSNATYTGEITNILRAWNNNVSNQGILVKANNEIHGIEIFAVKGSNAAEISKRPKLEIVFSRKK